jgi:Bacterial Ig-like domain
MKARNLLAQLALALLVVGLMACNGTTGPAQSSNGGGGDNGGGGSTPTESTAIGFQLSSLDDYLSGSTSTAQATGTNLPMDTTLHIDGELLVVPQDNPDNSTTYTFGIDIDPSTTQVLTVENLNLEAKAFNFYFLLKTPNTRFGGVQRNQLILGGQDNSFTMTLYPVIGTTVNSVAEFSNLARFAVRYDPDVLSTYVHPRIGIAINGGTEQLFDIRVDSANPQILLFLPAGQYTISVRFFDGAIVRDVPVEDNLDAQAPDDSDPSSDSVTEFQLTPLTAETDYTFGGTTPSAAGPSTFVFTVPPDVVDEVGGPDSATNPLSDRLSAVVSIVGQANPLEEQPLQLTPVTDDAGNLLHYSAQVVLDSFLPGPITWQLRFVDKSTNQEFAYCAESVDTTNTETPNHATFVCNLNLLVRQLATVYPTGTLQVSVTDAGGGVPGAVVQINDQPIGVTGGNPPGEGPGLLDAFLQPGDQYTLQVVDTIVDPYGSGKVYQRSSVPQTITIDADHTTSLAVNLPPFPFGAPTVLSTAPANGEDGVPVDTTISVTFSHAMLQDVTGNALSLTEATHGTAVPFTYDWQSSSVVVLTPTSPLAYLQEYNLQVDPSATDTNGISLQQSKVYHFTTGTEPDVVAPWVQSVSPLDHATGVDVNTTVLVTFSEPVQMGSVALTLWRGDTQVSGHTEAQGDSAMSFIPDQDLAYSTDYTVNVAAGMLDLVGNEQLDPFSSVFTTGGETDDTPPSVLSKSPDNGDVDVPVDSHIVVVFSEPIAKNTLLGAFTVSPDPGGSISWLDDQTVDYHLSGGATLEYGTNYTVTIGATVTDLASHPLGQALTWSFKTAAATTTGTTIELHPARETHPTRFDDDTYAVDSPITVLIPSADEVRVALDDSGNPIGNPNRYLVMLTLGKVQCLYLGGSWDRHIGGVLEDVFEHTFSSPVCTGHRNHAGSRVTVHPGDYSGSTWGDGNSSDHEDEGSNGHGHSGTRRVEITARVVTSDSRYPVTRMDVTIDVVPADSH